jgi:hypothetical protein
MIRLAIAVVLLAAVVSFATTWHVPEETGSIQAALDSVVNGDTIVVDPGVYSEALLARDSLSFVMIGVFDTTKDHEIFPIIDPSLLDSSNRKACLTLRPGDIAEIRGIMFRNQFQMYPRVGPMPTGGIYDMGQSLSLTTCIFDSTHHSVDCIHGTLDVLDCQFRFSVGTAIIAQSAAATITASSFTTWGQFLALASPSVVENCWFESLNENGWITLNGPINTICDNTFNGNPDSPTSWVIDGTSARASIFHGNIFHDYTLNVATLLLGNSWDGDDFTTEISDNFFQQINCTSPGGCAGISMGGYNGTYVITGNYFDQCQGVSPTGARAIRIDNPDAEIRDNVFLGSHYGVPLVNTNGYSSHITIHYQSFAFTGYAVRADPYGFTVDADSCWWGDSTGPHHPQLNPDGLGANVTGNIDFDPWFTSPDSTDSSDAATSPPALPSDTRLDAYPNPFNALAVVNLSVTTPGIYSVDLYNTLGQQVMEVWSGPIAGEKRMVLDGQSLSSGVYFLRLLAHDKQKVALLKVALLK